MKQLIYSMPPILYGMFIIIIIDSGGGSVAPIGYITLLLMSAGSLLLVNGKWWGFAFGLAAGLVFTLMGFKDTMQIIPEYVVGIPLSIFYIACAIFCRRDNRQHDTPQI